MTQVKHFKRVKDLIENQSNEQKQIYSNKTKSNELQSPYSVWANIK